MSKPINQTTYYVWQWSPDGEKQLWFLAHSHEELKEQIPNMIRSGADYRIEKKVCRVTDITEEIFKKALKQKNLDAMNRAIEYSDHDPEENWENWHAREDMSGDR